MGTICPVSSASGMNCAGVFQAHTQGVAIVVQHQWGGAVVGLKGGQRRHIDVGLGDRCGRLRAAAMAQVGSLSGSQAK